MNIFVLDTNPSIAAKYHFDTHVIKMPLEALQLLCTNTRLILGIDDSNLMKSTHENHPSSIFCRSSSENFKWVMEYCSSLFAEYTLRYGKIHASQNTFEICQSLFKHVIDKLEQSGKIKLTEFALAMPDECKTSDVVESYHKYYERKALQEIEKFVEYKQLTKMGIKQRKPSHRFVWVRGEKPSWEKRY